MKCQILFPGKNKRNISKCPLLNILPRVLNIKTTGLGGLNPSSENKLTKSWLVSVEVIWPSQPNGVMLSAVSLPNHTFTGQA